MNEYTLDYAEQNRLDTLPQAEMDKLCTLDEYPSGSFVFPAYGYDLHIRDELVAGAFASLPEQEQRILILYCVAAMADGEIGSLVGMSRSAVQRHRYVWTAENALPFRPMQCDLKCVENRRTISFRNSTPVPFSTPVCRPLSSCVSDTSLSVFTKGSPRFI